MIVPRKFARNLTKKKFADFASSYATEFANKLGYNREIIISPKNIIFDPKEAEEVFLKELNAKNYSKNDKFIATVQLMQLKKDILENAFIINDIAYLPIDEIPEYELAQTERNKRAIDASQSNNNFQNHNTIALEDYVNIRGFGAEIGHLVAEAIYSSRSKTYIRPDTQISKFYSTIKKDTKGINPGLSEAVDGLSQSFEDSKNVINTYRLNRKEYNQKIIEQKCLDTWISKMTPKLKQIELMLLEGDEAAKTAIKNNSEKELCTTPNRPETDIERMVRELSNKIILEKVSEGVLRELKREYMQTTHYEGIKILFETYKHSGGEINTMYNKIGELLSKPHPKTESIFLELGYTTKTIKKYRGLMERDILKRASKLKII